MTPRTNEEQRHEFAKIYGRMPSLVKLMQFKQNPGEVLRAEEGEKQEKA